MPFQIVRNDITKVKADAIVNTANPSPMIGKGTDRAIYNAAGAQQLLEARDKIGEIKRGDIAVTEAFQLKAKYIIHAVGPVWMDGQSGEYEILASCYQKSMEKALELGCRSIAFPLIATGVYGFPKDQALQIAIRQISTFLMTHELSVTLVVYDDASFELTGKVFHGVTELIDDTEVKQGRALEYGSTLPENELGQGQLNLLRQRELEKLGDKKAQKAKNGVPTAQGVPLEKLLTQKSETFQECLFRMIVERGLSDPDVYLRANIDRKHFSKIRCNPDYHPKKKTAVALAIAMKLSMEETVELLSKAEFALSSSSMFDIIITYFIENKVYDILCEINPVLFKYGQPLLGM